MFDGKILTVCLPSNIQFQISKFHCVGEHRRNVDETSSWSIMSRFFSSQLPGQSRSTMTVFLILHVNSWLLTRFTEQQRSPPKFRRNSWKWSCLKMSDIIESRNKKIYLEAILFYYNPKLYLYKNLHIQNLTRLILLLTLYLYAYFPT